MDKLYGTVLSGNEKIITHSYEKWSQQHVDQEMISDGDEEEQKGLQTSLGKSFSITGAGTFFGQAQRTLTFEPSPKKGWQFNREDLPGSMPIPVSVNNVWTVVRNIVLCSGSPHNYMRMVEHIIALKVGMKLDNVMIRMNSGDPPLLAGSSMDFVEAVENAGIINLQDPAVYLRVKEPVTMGGGRGKFSYISAGKKYVSQAYYRLRC